MVLRRGFALRFRLRLLRLVSLAQQVQRRVVLLRSGKRAAFFTIFIALTVIALAQNLSSFGNLVWTIHCRENPRMSLSTTQALLLAARAQVRLLIDSHVLGVQRWRCQTCGFINNVDRRKSLASLHLLPAVSHVSMCVAVGESELLCEICDGRAVCTAFVFPLSLSLSLSPSPVCTCQTIRQKVLWGF